MADRGCFDLVAVRRGCSDRGTVAGFDAWLGYTYKWYLKDHPYFVPYARAGLGGGFWKYPKVNGRREQTRTSTWNLGLRGGGGARLFLLRDLAIGLDLNLHLGFAVHEERPLGASKPDRSGSFLLGLEILPLVVEYRF